MSNKEENAAVQTGTMTQPAPPTSAPESPFKSLEERLDFFSVSPPGGAEVANDASAIEEAGRRDAETAEKAREATQNSLRAAGVAVVSAFERYASGDGSPASQRAAAYAARVLGDRLAEAKGIDGGVTSTIDFDRNGDFHLRFWRKVDGFPVQFDYATMRDGLQKQGYLDGLDKELRDRLGISSQSQAQTDFGNQMTSASAFFAALGKLDPRTRREFSRISGAAQQFYGGDEAALAKYLDELDAQEAAAKEAEAENTAARSGGAAQSWRFHDAWDAALANVASTRESMLGRLESALSDGVITQAQFDRYSKQIEDRDWNAKPAEPAVDFEKEFKKEWDSTNDIARREDLLREYRDRIPADMYEIYEKRIPNDAVADKTSKKGASNEAVVSDENAQSSGVQNGAPSFIPSESTPDKKTSKTEVVGQTTISGSGSNGDVAENSGSDDTNGPTARKGTYRENADFRMQGLVFPRNTYFDADMLEWDEKKGKYVPKEGAEPWYPKTAGRVIRHLRTEEPKKNGGVRYVHFVLDNRLADFGEFVKDASGPIIPLLSIFGAAIKAGRRVNAGKSAGMDGIRTAAEIFRRMGINPNGTAHGGATSFRMTKEQYDQFLKYVESGEMPPKPEA